LEIAAIVRFYIRVASRIAGGERGGQTQARTRLVSSIISAANEFAVQTGELAGRILHAARDLSQQAEVLHTDAAGFIGQVMAA
jgi:hypothetical protein